MIVHVHFVFGQYKLLGGVVWGWYGVAGPGVSRVGVGWGGVSTGGVMWLGMV